jgi:hypothetical protein
VRFGGFQALADLVEIRRRRADAFDGFLLEAMQHVHGVRESDGVDGSIRIAMPVFDYFDDTG